MCVLRLRLWSQKSGFIPALSIVNKVLLLTAQRSRLPSPAGPWLTALGCQVASIWGTFPSPLGCSVSGLSKLVTV